MELVKRLAGLPAQIVTYLVVIVGFIPLFTFFMKVLNRTEVRGREYVQRMRPPFLFCSNHVSMLDDAFVGPLVFMPRALWHFRFIPWHLPEKKNFFRGPFFSWLMRASRCVPITRGKGVFQPGMERMIRLLRQGDVAYVYPEGTRTRTGEIGKGKIGVGRLVRETGVPVIPCYHSGLDQVLPIGHKIPRFGHRVLIQVGEALRFDEYMQLPNTPKTWQMISDRIIASIQDLRTRMEASGEGEQNPAGPVKPESPAP
ncbi:MAG: 1-acyl-sn-glycerol-3-phosphate acyltransferase [Candidatus Zixiibacteriota bacterium]|nr:MAG: 1-acyl-sn-glycerol-3-phosphate acyltransferase [candidate division Zixibacteria bacterium]